MPFTISLKTPETERSFEDVREVVTKRTFNGLKKSMTDEAVQRTPSPRNEEDERELAAIHLPEVNQPELSPGGPADRSRRARQQFLGELHEVVGRKIGLDAMVRVVRNDAGDEPVLEEL
jgi:hypothetical protein